MDFSNILQPMNDTFAARPDHAGLFQVASGQHGYFTTAQAREFGVNADLLSHAVKRGKYLRVHRGVYRFRDYPSHPREAVVAAWLAVGKDRAVVSHESALDLLELSNVIPDAIHLTVARSERHLHPPPGVRLHTTTRPFERGDVTTREGIRITSPARTIADAAETGTGPEQVEMAAFEALESGQTTELRLERAIAERSDRVQRLVRSVLQDHAA
jgi:predicted transcriptional regulator of viral defense system